MENEYLKKVECLSSSQGKITKEDKVKVIYELWHKYSVKVLVAFAPIPRSTYDDLVKKMNRPDPNAVLKAEIQAIYNEHEGRYGYLRIRDELVNHKKVQRIMKALGLKYVVRMKKYNSYKGVVGKIAPNEKWVTDIAEFQLFGEKLYFSPGLDLFNREIIGSRPTYSLVSEMLEKALEHQLLAHSDPG